MLFRSYRIWIQAVAQGRAVVGGQQVGVPGRPLRLQRGDERVWGEPLQDAARLPLGQGGGVIILQLPGARGDHPQHRGGVRGRALGSCSVPLRPRGVSLGSRGIALGDHGLVEKLGFFEQSYHIVGIVRDPRRPGGHGRVVEAFTENVDVVPTIAEAIGARQARRWFATAECAREPNRYLLRLLEVPTIVDIEPSFPFLVEAGTVQDGNFVATHRARQLPQLRMDRGYPGVVRRMLGIDRGK